MKCANCGKETKKVMGIPRTYCSKQCSIMAYHEAGKKFINREKKKKIK